MINKQDTSHRENVQTIANLANPNFIHSFCNKQGHIKPDAGNQKCVHVSQEEILSVLHLTQANAADKLGISVSTLKRRFYQMDMGRWPYHNSIHQNVNPSNSASPTSRGASTQASNDYCFFKQHVPISKLVNEKNEEEKHLTPQTCLELAIAFKQYS